MFKSPAFKFFSSLKLAVISILLLALVLTVATVVESLYGTRAVHVLVYGTPWFGGVLFLLGLNVLCAALSRFPWKKSQTGFVLTHLGIIVLLIGSFVTQKFGVDATLPVTEASQDNEVILNDLILTLVDESRNLKKELPVNESYREKKAQILAVDFGQNERITLDHFVPRAIPERTLTGSPIPGLGNPALRVELFNSRFRLEENLVTQHPSNPTEINLGPALVTFQTVEGDSELSQFLNPKISRLKPKSQAFLIANFKGKEYRFGVDELQRGFVSFLGGQYEITADEYFPYAVVENNRLVNRSEEPINPAIHLTVRKKDSSDPKALEKHTIFANFPEFATLHGRQTKREVLGFKFRLEVPKNKTQELAFVGKQRGQLAFAQTVNNPKLYYRAQGKDGSVSSKGEIVLGKEIPTGWMDLNFKVQNWFPNSVEGSTPRSIDFISGSGDNYLSAIHLTQVNRSPAEDRRNTSPGWWLFEGQGRLINIAGREIFIQYTKKKLTLPFYLYLEKFKIGTDPGTTKAASYASDVVVKDPTKGVEQRANISMNEPLKYGGYTFYQASYSMEEGKPPVSVFAVNFDPGRQIKYLGSLIMCLGILVMFYMNPHYLALIFKRKEQSR